jgi:hypothetical protein
LIPVFFEKSRGPVEPRISARRDRTRDATPGLGMQWLLRAK